jgi:hypothetical protein
VVLSFGKGKLEGIFSRFWPDQGISYGGQAGYRERNPVHPVDPVEKNI